MKIWTQYCIITVFILSSFGYTHTLAVTTIKVGYLPILDHLTLLVSHAQDNDSFSQVNIQPKMFKAWGEMVGALRAGKIDAAFILSPLAMDLFNQGVDIKTVLLAHRDGSAITVKKGSDIRSATDLKGKVVAIPDRKATHTALLNHYLSSAGLSLQDIKTRVIAPPNMIKAMQLGQIDAFIVAEPFGAKAQQISVGEILVLTKDIIDDHVECIVVVKQSLLNNQRPAVQEWINSLIRAGRWIEQDKLTNHAQQVAKITAKKYLPHSEATIVLGLQNPAHRISFSNLNPVSDDFRTIMDISLQADIVKPIDLEAFIDNSFYNNFPDDKETSVEIKE